MTFPTTDQTVLHITVFKGPLKCFETHSVILCVDVILTETGRQGGPEAGASNSREHFIGQKVWLAILAEVTNRKL